MTKAILLDRDGVINQDSPNYIKSVDEFILLPGSIEAIAKLTFAGYLIGIATNQSGLARGYYSEKELSAIHDKMLTAIHAAGGIINAIEYCPHLPNAGCLCRKPKPGMLQALSKRLNCTLSKTYFVGDKISDIQAAEAAGINAVLIFSSGDKDLEGLSDYPHIPVFPSLLAWTDYMLSEI